MKAAWGMALALATSVALSACGSHAVRPVAGAGAGTSASGAPAVIARDNIHKSQAERYRLEHDRGPDRPPVDIATLPEPVPKALPRSRYGNASPYTVNGQTYHVLKTANGYDARGMASWYGKKFDGYLTSSMQRYDMYEFTAASKVLPLPTWVRVTNLANGKRVIVKVNDRGPFVAGRIIDLSYAAAVRIGIWPRGTGRVEVKALDPAHFGELSSAGAVPHDAAAGPAVWLQVGAYADAANAERVARRLRRADVGPVRVSDVTAHGQHFTRVRIGPLRGATTIAAVRAAIERLGLTATPVTVN